MYLANNIFNFLYITLVANSPHLNICLDFLKLCFCEKASNYMKTANIVGIFSG